MQFRTLTVLLASVAAVIAAPTESVSTEALGDAFVFEESSAVDKRQANSVAVKMCYDTYGGGSCAAKPVTVGHCNYITGGGDNQVSSVYIYPAGFRCDMFDANNCAGYAVTLYSGSTDVMPAGWNDRVSSFKCWNN